MNTSCSAVLAGFTPVQVAKPVPQRLTLELSAYGFARAYCMNNAITDKEGFRRVHRDVKQKFERYALSPSQIKRRQLVFFPRLTDIRFVDGHFDLAEPKEAHLKLYDVDGDPRGADLKTRLESYGKVVDDCLERMYGEEERAPDDLIHVTCTGYLAPSPVERMVSRKGWFETAVTHSYHMGCHGAFPAINVALGMLAASRTAVMPPKHRIDLVHTEIMSAHHNITDMGAENIVAMTLFADGLIRYSLYSEEELRRRDLRGLRILAFNKHLLPDSTEAMTETPGPHQFGMTLSVMVPVIIKRHVKAFVVSLLARAGLDFQRDKDALTFAVHPGGPRIVDHVQDELGLRDEQIAISQRVFHENGNMSSATIPHILKDVLENVATGTRIVCIGFGPGLTVGGLVLQKV